MNERRCVYTPCPVAASTSAAALPPRDKSRHAMTTLYPGFLAISLALMKPRPVLAPVMTQIFCPAPSSVVDAPSDDDAAVADADACVLRIAHRLTFWLLLLLDALRGRMAKRADAAAAAAAAAADMLFYVTCVG